MMSDEVLSIPDPVPSRQTFTLLRRISAIQLTRVDKHRGKLGNIVQLQPGTHLNLCGEGYNEKTVKVQVEGQFYFVFLEDLKTTESDRV